MPVHVDPVDYLIPTEEERSVELVELREENALLRNKVYRLNRQAKRAEDMVRRARDAMLVAADNDSTTRMSLKQVFREMIVECDAISPRPGASMGDGR